MLCLKIGILVLVGDDIMKTKTDDKIEEEYEAKIKGKFKIYLGNELYAKGKNKWTKYFPSTIVQYLIMTSTGTGEISTYTPFQLGRPSDKYTARAGNDTSTPTSPDMTDLVSKIDIAPNTQNRVLFKNSGYTEYKSRHKFSWNPGTIPAQTIGEFGVYLVLTDDSWESPLENPNIWVQSRAYVDKGYYPYVAPALRLGARISSGDGDFDPIDYTSEEALMLEWYVTIKF